MLNYSETFRKRRNNFETIVGVIIEETEVTRKALLGVMFPDLCALQSERNLYVPFGLSFFQARNLLAQADA